MSIVLNIAEGSDRSSDKDFIRYLRMSVGSVHEVVTILYISKDLKYISDAEFNQLYDKANTLVRRIKALIKSIK